METETWAYLDAIDRKGGMVAAIDAGYPQREIAESAYAFERAVEGGERIVVGVNAHTEEAAGRIPTLSVDPTVAGAEVRRVEAVRRGRDAAVLERALDRLSTQAGGSSNLMPALLEAARASATVGEMCDALRAVWGEYEEAAAV
jgi:methylmalonyl-CoA mutase N-terminal domain/subunit